MELFQALLVAVCELAIIAICEHEADVERYQCNIIIRFLFK